MTLVTHQFVAVDIISTLPGETVCQLIEDALPEFSWRKGSNDTQGNYLSGTSVTGERLQCWVDLAPMALSLSFRSSSLEESARVELVKFVLDDVISRLGQASAVRRQ